MTPQKQLPVLRSLRVLRCVAMSDLTPDALKDIGRLSTLRTLHLEALPLGSGAALSHLAPLRSCLTSLQLSGASFHPAALQLLQPLAPRLRRLKISGGSFAFDDTIMGPLQRLPLARLRSLDLRGCDLSPGPHLYHLSTGLQALRELWVPHTVTVAPAGGHHSGRRYGYGYDAQEGAQAEVSDLKTSRLLIQGSLICAS